MKPAEEPSETTGGTTVEDLERFRQDIERYRARRKAVADEFDGFVRSFTKPTATPVPEPPPVVRTPSASQRAAPVRPPAPPPSTFASVPTLPPAPPRPAIPVVPAAPSPVSPTAAPEPPSPPPVTATRRPASRTVPLLVVAGLAVLVAVWLWPGDHAPAPESVTPPATAAPSNPEAPPARAPVTPPPQAAPDPSQSELTTTRAVWIRVIADGNRIVSRELPAGARVPFKAEKGIEIRAGDAGAVRLSIGGRDQGTLGRDGAVVTRSFTVPPR